MFQLPHHRPLLSINTMAKMIDNAWSSYRVLFDVVWMRKSGDSSTWSRSAAYVCGGAFIKFLPKLLHIDPITVKPVTCAQRPAEV
jgi:hypothetical protein